MRRRLAALVLATALGAIPMVALPAWGDQPPGQLGYEGQPGHQGGGGNNANGQKGYEGQPGHQGGGGGNAPGLLGYEGQPGNQGG